MPNLLRWLIGFVALLGALVIAFAGATAGDMLPNGGAPLFVLAALFGAGAVFCFWPRHGSRQARAEKVWVRDPVAGDPVEESSEEEGVSPGRVRAFAVFMFASGAVFAVLGLLGRVPRRFHDVPPAVIAGTGAAFLAIGGVAMAFSFSDRSARLGHLVAKVLLYSILVAVVLVPVFAVAAVLLQVLLASG